MLARLTFARLSSKADQQTSDEEEGRGSAGVPIIVPTADAAEPERDDLILRHDQPVVLRPIDRRKHLAAIAQPLDGGRARP